eukprot:CAMPEP_0195282186 /NCGR_PEP_ID=MMETSP0707-20130614/1173_1 /TAXON_ID=33640 /ORGANISM="Asterionellopsis glacialis, Strain CCMP134" /LENGTH=203 /DNA_ID=CAMNT_0040341139 /DNA_START=185 /DNA_END=797 /DNA_ORIENTATION=+
MVLKPTTGIILSFMLTGGVQASTEHHPIPSSHYYDHDDHAKIHHDALSLQETTIGNRNQACTNSSNNNTLTNSQPAPASAPVLVAATSVHTPVASAIMTPNLAVALAPVLVPTLTQTLVPAALAPAQATVPAALVPAQATVPAALVPMLTPMPALALLSRRSSFTNKTTAHHFSVGILSLFYIQHSVRLKSVNCNVIVCVNFM